MIISLCMLLQTYTHLMDEKQSKKDQLEEIQKSITAKEDAIARIEEEFKEQMKLLHATQQELEGTHVKKILFLFLL